MSTKFLCLVTLILASLVLATSDDAQDVQECTSPLVGLATCLPYVGGTAKAPTPDCCTGLKQVLKTSKKCLCVVVKDRNDPNLGLQINVTLALGLPATCKTPADLSDCPALLKLAPNSPEAQIFYQLSHNTTATAPAPAPAAANGMPAPPLGRAPATGSNLPQGSGNSNSSSSYAKTKRGIVQYSFSALLLSCLFF